MSNIILTLLALMVKKTFVSVDSECERILRICSRMPCPNARSSSLIFHFANFLFFVSQLFICIIGVLRYHSKSLIKTT